MKNLIEERTELVLLLLSREPEELVLIDKPVLMGGLYPLDEPRHGSGPPRGHELSQRHVGLLVVAARTCAGLVAEAVRTAPGLWDDVIYGHAPGGERHAAVDAAAASLSKEPFLL